MQMVKVRVPGTSANCGAGFDTLGLACNIYNYFEIALNTKPIIDIKAFGEGAKRIACNEHNVVWSAARRLLQKVGRDKEFPGVTMRINCRVPVARGLGSSATAIVGGLKATNVALGSPCSTHELLQMATDMEGHPDNVAPALYGGFTVSTVAKDGKVESFSFLPKINLQLVVVVPDFSLSTRKAREVLPESVSRKDAIYNISHASMLSVAFLKGDEHLVRHAIGDALHEPYRAKTK